MATLGAMWIKICGITSADAVAAAAEANVDAIGFVFAPSPRQVTPGQAAQLAALAPPGILRTAAAQHPVPMTAGDICRILKSDYFDLFVKDPRDLKIYPFSLPDDLPIPVSCSRPRRGKSRSARRRQRG